MLKIGFAKLTHLSYFVTFKGSLLRDTLNVDTCSLSAQFTASSYVLD